MELKAAYLQKEIHDKATYLTLYGQSNELLAEQYADRRMSNKSLDVLKAWDASQMREIRCQNALVLYKGLENISGVNPLFPKEKMDCPLFVPIMVEGNRRDALRQYLIEQEIYCPVHWPVPEGAQSQIYDRELSLVCDQRYSIADMERILTCIRDFMKRN